MLTAAHPGRRAATPAAVAAAELAAGTISRVKHERRRDELNRRECSSVWAYDIWYGHDVDYLGVARGHGHAKVRCCDCGRDVPPQDTADRAMSDWHADRERGVRRERPTVVEPICTDCRTRAPKPRMKTAPEAEITRRSYFDERGIWELDNREAQDGSPSTPVLDAMADADGRLVETALPSEDDETLVAAVSEFAGTGDLAAYLKSAGDESIAAVQRGRYGVTKTVLV